MSTSELRTEENLNSVEEYLKGNMPEECLMNFKKFYKCKLDSDEELIKKLGYAKFTKQQTDPFSFVNGCKNEFNNLVKCQNDFVDRYMDLKNYVAEIEGKRQPFDKKEIERDLKKNMTTYNFGLNKF